MREPTKVIKFNQRDAEYVLASLDFTYHDLAKRDHSIDFHTRKQQREILSNYVALRRRVRDFLEKFDSKD